MGGQGVPGALTCWHYRERETDRENGGRERESQRIMIILNESTLKI